MSSIFFREKNQRGDFAKCLTPRVSEGNRESAIGKIVVPVANFTGSTNRSMEASMETTQQDIDRTFHHDAAGVHGIHTARKEGPCQFGRRVDGGERCANRIKPGDKYVAGDFDMHAGPWAQTRWCMHCVEFAIDAANATATAATNARLQDVA